MAEVSNSKLLKQIQASGQQRVPVLLLCVLNGTLRLLMRWKMVGKKSLAENGISDIRIINVPGAFEIAFAIKAYWNEHKYKDDKPDAFIALGCVLRGDTPHFDYVCNAVTDGVVQLNLHLPVPTVFGVLTVDNQQQADERIGGKHGHKGEEAAITALKMISLIKSFKTPTK